MGYLISSDYDRAIQDVTLQQIISGNAALLAIAESTAVSKAKSYLKMKYDVDREFASFVQYSDTATYSALARVTNNTDIYFAQLPFSEFNLSHIYTKGDKVFWQNHTYEAIVDTRRLSHQDYLQYYNTNNIPYPNTFPGTPDGETYWKDLGEYIVPANSISDTTYFTKGDNRNPELVSVVLNIVIYLLYARISPLNIPDSRVAFYNEAVGWLLKIAEGNDVTADIATKQPAQGRRIRWGSNVKQQNNY